MAWLSYPQVPSVQDLSQICKPLLNQGSLADNPTTNKDGQILNGQHELMGKAS